MLNSNYTTKCGLTVNWFSPAKEFGVKITRGVVRALISLWKSNIGVLSRVISLTELELEETELFHFLLILLMTRSFTETSDNQIVEVRSRSERINRVWKYAKSGVFYAKIVSMTPLRLRRELLLLQKFSVTNRELLWLQKLLVTNTVLSLPFSQQIPYYLR